MTSAFRPSRRLKVFAFDPSTARSFAGGTASSVTITLPFELDPQDPEAPFIGPKGEYVEVVDADPSSGAFYAPIDLNDAAVLHNDGLSPAPHDPRFHQQMVYAVSMNTIATFEKALGRVIQWSPHERKIEHADKPTEWVYAFTKRLRIYPHALREANAYYNPDKKALLFGYFTAGSASRSAPPGTTVFTCLSHDIVVHETVHAILDGLHPSYAEDTNPDMRALHEAFADLIALFQLFSFPSVLEDQIAKTKGDLGRQSLLGELAQEFGRAVGRGCALRDFLGGPDADGEWQAKEPDPAAYRNADGPHARGAVLVAAVFRAYLTIYKTRVSDLFRIASGGSGVLRDGEIDPDLKCRLAAEAAQCARRVMRICIRAMDYTPPVNVSFGDYLRAIITADRDLFPEDAQRYRAAFIEAFCAWGILPAGMPVISEPALCWPTLVQAEDNRQAINNIDEGLDWLEKIQSNLGLMLTQPRQMLSHLSSPMRISGKERRASYRLEAERTEAEAENVGLKIRERLLRLNDKSTTMQLNADTPARALVLDVNLLEIQGSRDREIVYHASNYYQRLLWLMMNCAASERFAELMGLCMDDTPLATIRRSRTTGMPSLHVASVRIAKRPGQRGQMEREYVIEVIQTRRGYFDADEQQGEDARKPNPDLSNRQCDFLYRTGTTFLVDARSFAIRRLIRTPHRIDDDAGLALCRDHMARAEAHAANAFYSGRSPRAAAFAALHNPAQPKDGFQ